MDKPAEQVAAVEDSVVDAIMREHVALPPALRNTQPDGTDSKVNAIVYDYLMARVPVGRSVSLHGPFVEHGVEFFRIDITVLGRKHWVVMRPYGAYILAKGIRMMHYMGLLDRNAVFSDNELGDIYVPRWAMPQFMDCLVDIIQQRKDYIQLVAEEHKRVVQKTMREEQDDEQPTDERVLH